MAGAPQFADISAFQPINIDWKAYRAWAAGWDGIARVSMRSSYGIGYQDVHFATYRQGALAAGVDVIIYYHYAYPEYNPDATKEADWQHHVVGTIRPNDILMLDYEEGASQANAAWAYNWLARQEQNYGGKLPTIYASDAYVRQRLQDGRLARFPLTLANWQYTPSERPPCPPPWQSYEYLQYTDKQTNIPGIAGSVDANIFLGKEDTVLSIQQVAGYFDEVDITHWRCKQTGRIIQFAILDAYKAYGNSGACGLTYLGLPVSNEIALDVKGNTKQYFERAVLFYDPNHVYDSPPGAGKVYAAHLYHGAGQDPEIAILEAELAAAQKPAGIDPLVVKTRLATIATDAQKIVTEATQAIA